MQCEKENEPHLSYIYERSLSEKMWKEMFS